MAPVLFVPHKLLSCFLNKKKFREDAYTFSRPELAVEQKLPWKTLLWGPVPHSAGINKSCYAPQGGLS